MLRRARAALASSGGKLSVVATMALTALALSQRISDHLGFELAEALALVVAIFGGAVGVAAARAEGGGSAAPSRTGLPMTSRGGANPLGAALGGSLAAALLLVLPVAMTLANGLRRPACDDRSGALLFALVTVPSALLAGAVGALCGLLWPRRGGALYALVLVGALASAVWPLYRGAQAFAFSPLLGWFPGPLYDEAIAVTPALVWFRVGTLAWLVLAWAAAPVAARSRASVPLVLLGALAVAATQLTAERAGWATSRGFIEQRLGGRLETAHATLIYPREKTDADAKALADDVEFRLSQLSAFFGAPLPPWRITVFVYRSAAEKRALFGAGATSVTQPWLHQVHVNDEPLPHPVLKHELAHAVAASFARPPFFVPARFRVVPNMGLIEGLAVAADGEAGDELTLHEWAAAMKAVGLAPDLPALLGLSGYGEAASRAYTYAGSFIRWLVAQKGAAGPAALRRAYETDDLADAFGAPLEELARRHAAFLEAITLPPRAKALAEQRFKAPSIFRRTCAREISRLAEDAAAAQGRQDFAAADAGYLRCAELEPDDPQYVLARFDVAAARGDTTLAATLAAKARALPGLGAAQRAELAQREGDFAWKRGDAAAARASYLAAAQDAAGQRVRLVGAKLAALDVPDAWPAFLPLLVDGRADLADVLRLREVAEPKGLALARYLIGRQLAQRREPDTRRYLDEALARGLPTPELTAEAERLDAFASHRAGDCNRVRALAEPRPARPAALQETLADLAERCAYEKR